MAKTTKKTASKEIPVMESRSIVAASPEELQRELNELLSHFDLYDIQNNTIVKDGKVQFIAFVYGREREIEAD